MRTFGAELSRGVHNRKRKLRKSFFRNNRVKRNKVRMNTDRKLSIFTQSSDIISLIDDDENVASPSTVGRLCGTHEDVQRVPQKYKMGHQTRCECRHKPRIKEPFNTNVVDLSIDQEQVSCAPQTARMRKRKRKSIVICGGDEIADHKKLMGNMHTTVVSDIGDEVKILGLDTKVIPKSKSESNVVMLQEQNDILMVSQTFCSLKTEKVKPTCSLECVQDEPASPDSTKVVREEQETNDSVIILDSDDDSSAATGSKSGRDYIPLVRKRLDTSVEVLDHVRGVPQSPELLVVKHISPPSHTSTKQSNEATSMFEDRTGNFEQFYDSKFWKKLKNQTAQRGLNKLKTGCAVTADKQSEPVKQRDDSNIYNPTPVFEIGGLRPIIIDGNNVAWGHGNHKYFSAPGLEICINYFVQRKHRVIAFVPLHRKTKKVPGLIEILDKYEKLGQIVMTPSRKIDGKTVSSYDDRYIVQAATELGGVIVSTDNYRDLMVENQRWKETIEKRLLMFTWVGDMLMFPQDPLGRTGPTLQEFLRFPN